MNIENRIQWIQDKVKEHGANGVILNLGFDVPSGVLAYLATKAFPNNSLVVWAGTQTPNKRHFLRNAELAGVNFKWINVEYGLDFVKMTKATFELSNPYKDLETMEKYYRTNEVEIDRSYKQHPDVDLIIGDLKARWKASVVESHGRLNNYLVMSSLDKSKYEAGLFTKGGEDSGVIAPLLDLTHSEIIEIANEIGMSKLVIDEVPSRGYYEGQSDEEEMGVSYEVLDKYLKGEEVSESDKNIILELSSKAKPKKAHADLLEKFN